jgi:hypothetical protein
MAHPEFSADEMNCSTLCRAEVFQEEAFSSDFKVNKEEKGSDWGVTPASLGKRRSPLVTVRDHYFFNNF